MSIQAFCRYVNCVFVYACSSEDIGGDGFAAEGLHPPACVDVVHAPVSRHGGAGGARRGPGLHQPGHGTPALLHRHNDTLPAAGARRGGRYGCLAIEIVYLLAWYFFL